MAFTKEQAKGEIAKLVEKYNKVIEEKREKNYNEETTKKDFILPLFRSLGWDVEDSREVSAEENISKKRVDYGFRINGIPKFFLEAKPLKADLEDPAYAMQAIEYSWNKDCTWALLTNFESLKIFNAEWKTPHPSENQLKTISVQEYLNRFDELWLLSKESFEQNLLDKEAVKWSKKAKIIPIDKQLLIDFTKFRELLSKNITKLNQNKNLTEGELDESVQRILDRLIFIRNCEDRELEAKTLSSNLREWESRGTGHLIKSLREVFTYFDNEYDSEIFTKHLCDDLDIDNEVLSEIIEGLYHTKEKLAYDFSAIEADVLGNIYEQYLGHILKKTEKRATITEAHDHRKEQGIYYTPTYVVDYIVKNTVGGLIKNKKSSEVDRIRVLDPACGSGSFLIKAFDVLNEYYSAKEKKTKTAGTTLDELGALTRKVKILQNNIYGVDLDKQAVEVAQLNLLLKIAEKRHRLPSLRKNIKQGNSLIDDLTVSERAFKWEEQFPEVIKEGGFDAVIGNPPYIRIHNLPTGDIEFYRKKFYAADGQFDLFCLFIEKAISLLRETGRFGFIIPSLFLRGYQYSKIRGYISDNTKIISVVDLGDKVFKEVQMPTCIIILEKCSNSKARRDNKFVFGVRSEGSMDDLKQVKMSQMEVSQDAQHIIQSITAPMPKSFINKFSTETVQLDKLVFITRGLEMSKKHEGISEEIKSKDDLPILSGEEIDRYRIKKTKFIRKNIFEEFKKDKRIFENEKLLIRETGSSLTVVYDNAGLTNLRTLYNITRRDSSPPLKFLLGILNSRLMQYYYSTKFRASTEIFPKIRIGQVKELPIKVTPESQQKPIIEPVNKMLSLNKRLSEIGDKRTDEWIKINEDIKKTDAEIDELVYKLYGISEEEKRVIEESLK